MGFVNVKILYKILCIKATFILKGVHRLPHIKLVTWYLSKGYLCMMTHCNAYMKECPEFMLTTQMQILAKCTI